MLPSNKRSVSNRCFPKNRFKNQGNPSFIHLTIYLFSFFLDYKIVFQNATDNRTAGVLRICKILLDISANQYLVSSGIKNYNWISFMYDKN